MKNSVNRTWFQRHRVSTATAWAAVTLLGSASALAGDAETGKAKTQELGCVACHGPDGNGADPKVPQVPRLAGQYADYLVQALKDYRTGKRKNPIMAGFAANLTDDDRRNIAAYYASRDGLKVLSRDD